MKGFLKRLGLILVALLMLCYVGYQVFQVLYSNVTVETVSPYSVFETVEAQAIAIRQETPVQAEIGDGYLFYTVNNGARVRKGGTVAQIFRNEEVAGVCRQLQVLDEDIARMESVEALALNNYASLEAINQQMASTVQEIAVNARGNTADRLRDLHADLLELMNKRQLVVGTVESFGDRLAQMKSRRASLTVENTDIFGSVKAPVAGYFIDTVDGYETYFSTDDEKIAALKTEDIRKAIEAAPEADGKAVGKIASAFTWYLACTVPPEKAAQLEEGDTLNVLLPFVTGETVQTTVLAVNRSGKEDTALILKCNLMSEQLAAIRVETVQLLVNEHSGLKLPDSALQFDSENHTGAYVRIGTSITFRYVNVLYHNEKDKYSICEITEDSAYVQVYDDVIVKGKNLYDGKVVQS